ncbi:hypothetical protein Cgig2_010396 [Carnegiea gigantea]|uniref:Uncharacterized protein n=1 Tax=Carnegiea gigantea TaxID=171969 RepID=A0A9Q1QDY7_9CARY|nr:hypothetical protein Cgig2_010396 [Carnegiea gigantea]
MGEFSYKVPTKEWVEVWLQATKKQDQEQNTILVDPSWWEEKVKVHSHFREHGLENATEMEIIFSKAFATGEHSWDRYTSQIFEVGNVILIEKEHNMKKKISTSDKGNEKAIVPNKSKVDTATGMRYQLGQSKVGTASRMGVDPPGCSIAECISLLKSLPSVDLGSESYMLGVGLFIKRQYREIFIALEDDDVRVAWLEDELKREHISASGH